MKAEPVSVMKYLSVAYTIISILIGALIYVIRTEVKGEVSKLRERVIALETFIPELAENLREVKEDVRYVRRNLQSMDHHHPSHTNTDIKE